MSGKSNDKFYKTVVFAEDMTDTMLEKVVATAKDAFQLQVTVRLCLCLSVVSQCLCVYGHLLTMLISLSSS